MERCLIDVKNGELSNAYTQGIDAYEETAAVHLSSSSVDCDFWIVDSAGTTYLSVGQLTVGLVWSC